MYIYMYTYYLYILYIWAHLLYIYNYIYNYIDLDIDINRDIYIHIYTCAHVYIYIWIHTQTYACIYIYINIHVYIYIFHRTCAGNANVQCDFCRLHVLKRAHKLKLCPSFNGESLWMVAGRKSSRNGRPSSPSTSPPEGGWVAPGDGKTKKQSEKGWCGWASFFASIPSLRVIGTKVYQSCEMPSSSISGLVQVEHETRHRLADVSQTMSELAHDSATSTLHGQRAGHAQTVNRPSREQPTYWRHWARPSTTVQATPRKGNGREEPGESARLCNEHPVRATGEMCPNVNRFGGRGDDQLPQRWLCIAPAPLRQME